MAAFPRLGMYVVFLAQCFVNTINHIQTRLRQHEPFVINSAQVWLPPACSRDLTGGA
jgi:hypothetical protein